MWRLVLIVMTAALAELRRVSTTRYSWLAPFVLLNLIDVAQTTVAMRLGATELNPLAGIMGIGHFLALKLCAAVFVGYVLRKNVLLLFLTAGMLGAVLGNMVTLAFMFS